MSINSPIKIVHVISSLKIGGAEQWLIDMVRALASRGCAQKVIYFHKGPHLDTLETLGIECEHARGWLCMYDPGFWNHCKNSLQSYKPDIIHSSLWAANFIARIMGWWLRIPVINTYHSAIDHQSFIRRMLDTISGHLATKTVSVSSEVKTIISKVPLRARPANYAVIQNGIDFVAFDALVKKHALTREQLHVPADAFIIGSVGRFVPVKNFFFLLEVVAEFSRTQPNVYAFIVGIGPLENDLRAHARKLGIEHKVRFYVGQPASAYYSVMDCYVQTSLHEGFGLAVLEAMYMRLPVIVSSQDGKHHFIQDGENGLIIHGYRHADYVKSLQLVAEHENLRRRLGNNAHDLVKKGYSSDSMVGAYQKLYQEVLIKKQN